MARYFDVEKAKRDGKTDEEIQEVMQRLGLQPLSSKPVDAPVPEPTAPQPSEPTPQPTLGPIPQPTSQPTPQPTPDVTDVTAPKTRFEEYAPITGRTVEQHRKALSRATGAGNKAAIKQIKGQLDIEESSFDDWLVAQERVAETEKEEAKEAKTAKKDIAVVSAIGTIIDLFDEVPEKDKGFIVGQFTTKIPGLSPVTKQYEESRLALAGTLKEIVGETGRLTDKDIERIVGLLPSAREVLAESAQAKKNLAKFLGDLGFELPESLKDTGDADVAPKEPPTFAGKLIGAGKKVGKYFFGEIADVAIDVKQSVGMDKKIEAFDAATKKAQKLIKEGKVDEANALLDSVMEESRALAEGFSESVEKSALERGLGVGLEVGTAIAAPGAIKGVGKVTMAGGKALFKKAFTPKTVIASLDEGLKVAKSGQVMRNAAVKTAQETGKKVDGGAVFRDISKWAVETKRAFPKDKKTIDALVEGLKPILKGKKLNPKTAKGIWDATDSGFSQAGKAGDGLSKSFFRAYRKAIRTHLNKVAPKFDEGTKLIRKGLKQEKLLGTIRTGLERATIKKGLVAPVPAALKKVGGRVATGAAAGLGLVMIGKILGIRFPGAAE